PGTGLFGMSEDKAGILWIGGEDGVFGYDPSKRAVVRVFSENNRVGRVFRISTDRQQNIWFNSTSGYWCWLRGPDRLVHFEYDLGIPRTYEGIVCTTDDGSVYCGGKDAIIRFFPDRIVHYKVAATTRIVEAVIHDTSQVAFALDTRGQQTMTVAPE